MYPSFRSGGFWNQSHLPVAVLTWSFVAPAACLIESDGCGREYRASKWAEPSRSCMGLGAGWLLRRIGCGGSSTSVNSMLAGRCWDLRERAFSPRTMRSTEGLDRRALATVTFPSSPSVIGGVRQTSWRSVNAGSRQTFFARREIVNECI